MKISTGIFTGLVVLGLLCLSGIAAAQATAADTSGTVITDDIQPYNGPIGVDNPLYGLKLAFENMDESFTTNQTERVEKQVEHGRLRIAEVKEELALNQTDLAQHALDLYWQKMNLTETTIAQFQSNTTGLFHAQEEIAKHQYVLEQLLLSHPNNTGLQRAYNNSLDLEEKFAEKTAFRFNRTMERDNRTILRAFHFGQNEPDNHGRPFETLEPNETRTQPAFNETPEKLNGQDRNKDKHDIPVTNPTLTWPSPEVTPSRTQENQAAGNQQHGNADNNGKGNPHNK
jgi:hypothetical protein